MSLAFLTSGVRFYEKAGLIKGNRLVDDKSNNYFHYNQKSAEKLKRFNAAKSIGFTINEISNLIDAWNNKKLSMAAKLSVYDEKLLTIENKKLKPMQNILIQLKKNIISSNC